MVAKKQTAKPMGKRTSVKKRGKNGVPIPGERKKSATGAPITDLKSPNRLGEPRLIAYEKNSDGGATVRVGKATVDLLEGLDDVKDWSDEELLAGHRHNIKRPPNVIPMGVYLELMNRVLSRAKFYFVAELEVAMKKHMEIIANIDAGNPDKPVTMVQWLAIKEVYERVMGSPEQKVTVGLEPESWKAAIANALVPSSSTTIEVNAEDPDDDDPINAAV